MLIYVPFLSVGGSFNYKSEFKDRGMSSDSKKCLYQS